MAKSEKETRLELIDPKLRRAGWEVLNTKYIIERGKACIETPVSNMPSTTDNPTGNGFVDYVLFGDDGKPLAIIEAKKCIVNESQGRVQACLYADAIEKQYGVRPIIYYTNGYSIKLIDGIYPDRVIFGFHRKDELEYLIQRRDHKIVDDSIDNNICDRTYQHEAIEEIIKYLGNKHSRSLIVLATGTGKTRVSCALSDIFIRNNYVKRILFLADRKNLVVQAKEECFEKLLPSVPMSTIIEGKRESDEDKARIVFSTYQSMLSIIRDLDTCPYGIGHFDLIIVDEAHRSLFNKYAEIFDYFDALMIGLTATPRNDIHKSTYRVFNLDKEEPNYEYDVVKGVKDGYLTYYRALDRTPNILKDGLTYSKLSDEEKEQYEDLFTDEEGKVPEKIEGKKFYDTITNKDTIREVLKDLMEEGIKVNNGDVLGKTIIFAKDHHHAVLIQDIFREMYPEKCIANPVNGVDYCVIIDNKIKYNEVLQREFKNKQDIRIVISVDMMDTGVDIPELVNLVFFKKVLSKIKFWQMIGRGTRICKDIKAITPSRSYFERLINDTTRQYHQDKQGFLIFDICNVFPYFNLNPEGKEDKSDVVLSLYQKIYMQKVSLYKAMQNNFSSLTKEEKKYYEELRDDLINEIVKLNRNYIGVIKNMQYIDKYSKVSNWLNFNQTNYAEIKKYVAPSINGEIDTESARAFDYLCYRFAANKFYLNNDYIESGKKIYNLSNYLLSFKKHITDVSDRVKTLQYVITDEFINDSKVNVINNIRIELRDLMRYIDETEFIPIISDFDDDISSKTDVVEKPLDFSISVDDYKTLEDKVKFLIRNNYDDELVHQIQFLMKPQKESLASFKKKIIDIAKSADEYNALFNKDENIISFIRKNIEFNPDSINDFLDIYKEKGYSDMKIDYIRELFTFISQNGQFDKQNLLLPELNFNGIFNSIEINELIESIENIMSC